MGCRDLLSRWTQVVSMALIAVGLAACQTTSEPTVKATPVASGLRAPFSYSAFERIAETGLKPGPLLLHGGGGGRRAGKPEAFFEALFEFARRSKLNSPQVCLIEAAAPDPRPFERADAKNGITFIFLGITPENRAVSTRDPKVLGAIHACSVFYFAGGDPSRLSTALLENNGADTPALKAIRQRHAEGAAVTGSSAGAMAASKTMMCECGAGSSVDALVNNRLKLAPGLRFVSEGLIDAHFLERGLIGRLVGALKTTAEPFALGLDEDTAVLIPGDGTPWTIIGESGAVALRPTSVREPYRQIAVDLLADGDRYDPSNGSIQISPARPQIIPARVTVENSVSEVFATGAFRKLMELAAINATGLAAGGSQVPGIRVSVTRTPETKVYFASDLPGDRAYSLTGLRLSVTAPVAQKP